MDFFIDKVDIGLGKGLELKLELSRELLPKSKLEI